MPVSVARRLRRLCTSANRKVCIIRWISRQTVGVCQFVRTPGLGQVGDEKAGDGAEKSFRRCKRKRQRGQRRGKKRSRGDKPRSSSPPRPLMPKGKSARCINHSGRKFIWGERARGRLVNSRYFRVLEQSLSSKDPDRDRSEMIQLIDDRWASHLRALRAHARKAGIPDGANPFSRSALDFVLTNSSIHSEMAFHDILGGLQFNVSPAAFHEMTVGADRKEEEMGLSESEPSARGKKSGVEEDRPRGEGEKKLRRRRRRDWEPEPGSPISGIRKPWERRESVRRGARRPFRRPQNEDRDVY
jgi:hypothetical protein